MSVRTQCRLLGVTRSTLYYKACQESAEKLGLMRRLDELHLAHPVFGSRRLQLMLGLEGVCVNRKRLRRLLQMMGIEAIHPKQRTSCPGDRHQVYPCLLKGLKIQGPDQVWCNDITYIPL